MKTIQICGEPIRFYIYRTARVCNWQMKIELGRDDFNYLTKYLEKYGFKMDNHIVFVTERGAFWWSDNNLYIGGEVVEGLY